MKITKCCNEHPVFFVPAAIGVIHIDESLTPSVECNNCGRVSYGDTQEEAATNWNAVDI